MRKCSYNSLNDLRLKLMGQWLAEKRKAAALTQMDVSRFLGFSTPQFVSNWERGLSIPSKERLPELAKLLHIPPKAMIEVYEELMQAKAKLETAELISLFRRKAG